MNDTEIDTLIVNAIKNNKIAKQKPQTEPKPSSIKIYKEQLKRLYTNKDYAPIIPLTGILYNIDSLNETALYYRIHTLLKLEMTFKAKKQFNYFIIRYNKIMGDDFPYTYKDVIQQIPDELK